MKYVEIMNCSTTIQSEVKTPFMKSLLSSIISPRYVLIPYYFCIGTDLLKAVFSLFGLKIVFFFFSSSIIFVLTSFASKT